uniref:Ig-like domain-containing protein n=1 Tax=Astatotilapia calliptera TaxID=8154 RepID=A0AAX7V4U7_ASTCA
MSIILSCLSMYFSDVEASSGKHMIHKKVGDTVELSSGLPTEGVTVATWKYGENKVAEKDKGVSKKSPFKDRSELNLTDFTLTVRKLTLQDSGNFTFVSEVNDKQRPSVTITLQIHEPITKQPVIKINSTRIPSNESCKVLLECSTTGDVSYKWIVGNQTLTGPRQQYIIREQDGETNVTCTVSNHVSEKSAFQTVKCSNSTQQEPAEPPRDKGHITKKDIFLFVGVAGGCLVLVTIVTIVGVCCCRKRHIGSDTNDLTVYADVSELTKEDGTGTMQPCSVYETIDNRVPTVKPGPQTVYDKIQLNRVRKVSVSPYQDVS